MSRMRRMLSVHTSLGPAINYTLQASIPSHMLTRCAAALPRPPWEAILYYSALCIMAFLLFCILIASYFEADRIFTADILKRRSKALSNNLSSLGSSPSTFDKSRVFDLRNFVGSQQRASVVPVGGLPDPRCLPHHQQSSTLHYQQHQVHPMEPQSSARRRSIFIKPLILLKSLFSQNVNEPQQQPNAAGNSRHPTTERQNSHEKESQNGSFATQARSTAASSDKQFSPASDLAYYIDNTNNTKTPVNNTKDKQSNKRSKAAKRPQIDLISCTTPTTSTTNAAELSGINVNDSTNNNKKQSNQNVSIANGTGVHRMVSDADHTKSIFPDKNLSRSGSEPKSTTPEVKVASTCLLAEHLGKKASCSTGMNQLDVIDTSDVIITQEQDDLKKEGKSKNYTIAQNYG